MFLFQFVFLWWGLSLWNHLQLLHSVAVMTVSAISTGASFTVTLETFQPLTGLTCHSQIFRPLVFYYPFGILIFKSYYTNSKSLVFPWYLFDSHIFLVLLTLHNLLDTYTPSQKSSQTDSCLHITQSAIYYCNVSLVHVLTCNLLYKALPLSILIQQQA